MAEVAGIGKIAIEEGVKTAHKVVDIIKENPQINSIKETRLNRIKGIAELCDWSMPEGGKMINGRWYTQHALERMAPDTIEVRAILSKRAIAKGKMPGTKPFKDYVDPRGIPPSVVEDAIENGASMIGKELGTLHCEGGSIHVVIIDEKLGNVVSIIPK